MRTLLGLIAGLAGFLAAMGLSSPWTAALLPAVLAAAAALLALRPAPTVIAATTVVDDAADAGAGIDGVLDAIMDPLLVVDQRRVTHANAAARRLLGDHVVGDDIRLAIRHPAAADRLIGPLSPRSGDPVEIVGLGEHDRRFALSVHPLPDAARLARLVDRTAVHAAERARVDFVANASHELRTPLATLLGFIETLEDRNAAEDAPTRARFLKIMFGEAKRMQRLVDDLMSLSRIEADRYSMPQDAVPLDRLVEEVRQIILDARELGADRIRLTTDAGGCAVTGDRAQLSQLVDNLVGNALKYGGTDQPVMVHVGCTAPGLVTLSVEDRGDGIPAEHLPRITERFYRVDPGRSRSLGGTGLGLAIVKHIVERHRGRMQIDSVVGRGTTVTVQLPAAPVPDARPDPLSSNRHETVTGDAPKRDSRTAGAA